MDFSLDQEQYEALISLARQGAKTAQQSRELNAFLVLIERKNGITRHGLWVQWQEADAEVPATAHFPETWPPEMRLYIEFLSRPIDRSDVESALKLRARNPVTVLVTPDPAALVGWTKVAEYFL